MEGVTTPIFLKEEKGTPLDSSSSSSHNIDKVVDPRISDEDTKQTQATKQSEVDENGEPVYITGLPFWLILIALCLAVFVLAIGNIPFIVVDLVTNSYLDNTIIATAIPKITDRFNSLDDIAWYASGKSFNVPLMVTGSDNICTAYMLTTGCFQLLFGRLYATFSTKWVFIAAISVFEFGSLICAVTPSSIGLSTDYVPYLCDTYADLL